MYETQINAGQSESCKEPDWEAEIAKATKNLNVIKSFKACLIEFIDVIGPNSLRRKESSIQELLGTVLLDIIDREKQVARFMDKLEKPK